MEKVVWKFLKVNGEINRKYKVSSTGRIVHSNGMGPLREYDMCKKSALNGSDYKAVHISGLTSNQRVHRLVCETFHGPAPVGKNQVDHIDEYKDNNAAKNLRWVSASENLTAWHQNNEVIRYSTSKVSSVKRMINKGWTNDRIAQKAGMTDSTVSSIKLGRLHVGVAPVIVLKFK